MTNTSNTSSANGSLFQQQSYESTGQKEYTMATSETLLPTPNTMEGLEPKTLERIVQHNQKNRPGRSYLGQNLRELVAYGHRKMDGSPYSQEDFPANHLATLDEEKERQMTAIYGQKCLQLFKTRNLTGLSLKTCVASLLGTKEWFSNKCALTWKAKVTKSNRLLFQLSPSMRRTEEIVSGLLLTPTGSENEQDLEKFKARMEKYPNGTTMPNLATQIGSKTGVKLRLQPAMTEWMMGYPDKWTELPLAQANTAGKDLKRAVMQ